MEENNHKLKFYIDEQGKPNFQDRWTDRIPRDRFNEAWKSNPSPPLRKISECVNPPPAEV
jgi:hypothetical protein